MMIMNNYNCDDNTIITNNYEVRYDDDRCRLKG